jgi:SAM-dependent methyltransferase
MRREGIVSRWSAGAHDYDAWFERRWGVYAARIEHQLLLDNASSIDGHDVCDAGCGTGRFASRLESAGARVTGVDQDRAALEIARTRINGTLVQSDVQQLPFPDSSFDVTYAVIVCEFTTDPRRDRRRTRSRHQARWASSHRHPEPTKPIGTMAPASIPTSPVTWRDPRTDALEERTPSLEPGQRAGRVQRRLPPCRTVRAGEVVTIAVADDTNRGSADRGCTTPMVTPVATSQAELIPVRISATRATPATRTVKMSVGALSARLTRTPAISPSEATVTPVRNARAVGRRRTPRHDPAQQGDEQERREEDPDGRRGPGRRSAS